MIPESVRHRHEGDLFFTWGGHSYRNGCVFYSDRYRDWHWHCDRYYFEPAVVVVVSPFYFYPELPPYLNPNCVEYSGDIILEGRGYRNYTYVYPAQGGFVRTWDDDPYTTVASTDYSRGLERYADRTRFDQTIDNIVDAFKNCDARFIENVTPYSGRVAIYQDGQFRYSLGAADFSGMYRDLIEGTRSRGYEIDDVRVYPDRSARVIALHRKVDAAGNVTTVKHDYWLAYENRQFVIRRFGVSYLD